MSLTVTNHALYRYATKIKDNNIVNVSQIVPEEKDRYTEDMQKMFEHSRFIYQGKFADNKESRFYLASDMILVLDNQEDKLVTIYRIDYGFEPEVNKMIREQLLADLDKAKQEVDKSKSAIAESLNSAQYSLKVLKAEKADLEASLEAVNSSIETTEDYINTLSSNLDNSNSHYNKVARQLCYSIVCKKALDEDPKWNQ